FQQYALTAHQTVIENKEVTSHAQEVATRADRANLIPKTVIQLEQFLERGQKLILIVFANVLIPVVYLCVKHAWAVQDIERLAYVCRGGTDSEHFTDPRGTASMSASDKNGIGYISHGFLMSGFGKDRLHSINGGCATIESKPRMVTQILNDFFG